MIGAISCTSVGIGSNPDAVATAAVYIFPVPKVNESGCTISAVAVVSISSLNACHASNASCCVNVPAVTNISSINVSLEAVVASIPEIAAIANSPASVNVLLEDAVISSFPSIYNFMVLDSFTITARCHLLSATFVVPVNVFVVPSELPAIIRR